MTLFLIAIVLSVANIAFSHWVDVRSKRHHDDASATLLEAVQAQAEASRIYAATKERLDVEREHAVRDRIFGRVYLDNAKQSLVLVLEVGRDAPPHMVAECVRRAFEKRVRETLLDEVAPEHMPS